MADWRERVVCLDHGKFELGPIWSKGDSLRQVAGEILMRLGDVDFDSIACVEAKGIILGAAVSALAGRELRVFRKLNRILYTQEKSVARFTNWRGQEDGVEIERAQISRGDRLIVIDDVVDTGRTFGAVGQLVALAEARVVRFVCIKNLSTIASVDDARILSLL